MNSKGRPARMASAKHETFLIPAVITTLAGLGVDTVGNSLDKIWPDAPHIVWLMIFSGGTLMMLALPAWLVYTALRIFPWSNLWRNWIGAVGSVVALLAIIYWIANRPGDVNWAVLLLCIPLALIVWHQNRRIKRIEAQLAAIANKSSPRSSISVEGEHTYNVVFAVPKRITPRLTFRNLPAGVTYEILENSPFGFRVKFSGDPGAFAFEADARL